jgi:hypothetical protein
LGRTSIASASLAAVGTNTTLIFSGFLFTKPKNIFPICYVHILFIFLAHISPNVPVVNDGFVVAIKEMRSISSNHKTVAE